MVAFLLKCDGTYSVVQAMQNSHRLDESYWKALVSNGIPKLDVLTAPPIRGQRIPLQVDRLAGVLQFARTVYSATVVDLGRFLTAGALAAIPEIDHVLIVTTLDVLALHQAKKIVESLLDVGCPRERIGIVLNRVTGQRDLEPEDVEKLLGVTIQSVLPEDAGALHDAYSEGKLLDEHSKLLEYITRLARRLSGIPEPAHKKRFGLFGG
jgi:pilus assembly protein CpaE